MMNLCMFLSESDFEEDGFNSGILMSMIETYDSSYALDLKSIRDMVLS